jgi:hypothetical protein
LSAWLVAGLGSSFGKVPPAPAGPPRGPGSCWAKQQTAATTIPAKHLPPCLAAQNREIRMCTLLVFFVGAGIAPRDRIQRWGNSETRKELVWSCQLGYQPGIRDVALAHRGGLKRLLRTALLSARTPPPRSPQPFSHALGVKRQQVSKKVIIACATKSTLQMT